MYRILWICFWWILTDIVYGQSPAILRGDQTYHTYDRAEILRWGDTSMINGINNYDRKRTMLFFKNAWDSEFLSDKDRYSLLHIYSDNYEFLDEGSSFKNKINKIISIFKSKEEEAAYPKKVDQLYFKQKGLLKYFYKSPANFLQIEVPSFKAYINPVVEVDYYKQNNNNNPVFQNTRGVEIRGYIEEKVYFYTKLLDNQRNYLSFTEDRIKKFKTLPGQGFWKAYESSVIEKLKGYDFFYAQAYLGFNPIKSINVELGHGNHFIGNGIRSLLLSDYSHNYFYLKLNTYFWKFQYQNIFAELAPISSFVNPGDVLLPKKYSATHYLAFKPSRNWEIGLFETVVFSRADHFEFQYLNPVILYRAVEHYLDSPDNVMLGLNLKINPIRGISLYGQLALDEFKLSEVKKQAGWWANKFGAQAGIKYMNALGVDNLDVQVEYNVARPYMYSHTDYLPGFPQYSIANYSHYNQPLAHPLGANFREWIFIGRYKPANRLYLQAKGLMTLYGDDGKDENWGSNILLPTQSRQMDEGNRVGQGVKTQVMSIGLDASYEIFHNYYLDLHTVFRKTTTDAAVDQSYIGGGIRINLPYIGYDY